MRPSRTAWVVGDGLLATTAHVAETSERIRSEANVSDPSSSSELRFVAPCDVALLHVSAADVAMSGPPLPVAGKGVLAIFEALVE